MMSVETGPAPSPLWRWMASDRLSLGLVALALALQAGGHLDCDVSWFITYGEKYLGGATPYVDVTDPNPPFAFLSLLPPIIVAHALGVPCEAAVVAYVFLLAGASILLCGAVLNRGPARTREEKGLLRNGALFLFLVTPGFAFGQREQLAVMLMAPMFLLLAVTDDGARPPRALRVAVGALAGLAVGFKPFYILPLALPIAEICWRRRSVAGLFRAEILSAAAGAAAQFLCILFVFPAYLQDQWPSVVQVYARIRAPLSELLLSQPIALAIVLLAGLPLALKWAAAPGTRARLPSAARVFALAATGFLVTVLLQGKGWINHAYPTLVLTFFAWIFALLDADDALSENRRESLFRFCLAPALALTPVVFLAHVLVLGMDEFPGLREAVTKIAPSRPRIVALANQMVVGHPVSRQVGAEWVGRSNALWLSHAAAVLLPGERDPATRARLEAFIHRDLEVFAEDVRQRRPEVILVESPALRAFAEARPETQGVLSDYALSGRASEIEIWQRDAGAANAPGK